MDDFSEWADSMQGCCSHSCAVRRSGGMSINTGKCYCPEYKIRRVLHNMSAEIYMMRSLLAEFGVDASRK